jgi:hypothetical protein
MSLIPCNADAPLEADLRVLLLLNEDTEAVSSSSAERLRFEMDEKTEGGRTGVDGGGDSSSLGSSVSVEGIFGGPICAAAADVLLEAISGVFEMAPKVCFEGRKAWTPLTLAARGMIACIRSKCGNPFDLNGAASLFF